MKHNDNDRDDPMSILADFGLLAVVAALSGFAVLAAIALISIAATLF